MQKHSELASIAPTIHVGHGPLNADFRADRRRRQAVAKAIGVLLELRSGYGDEVVAEAVAEAGARVLRECRTCGEPTQHRDGICLGCGAWD